MAEASSGFFASRAPREISSAANERVHKKLNLKMEIIQKINKKSKSAPGSAGELLVIALPMMASNALDTLMTFTNRIFLARLGSDQMNAAVAGGTMSFMLMTFFVGLIGYSTALIGQYYGAGEKKKCSRVVFQAAITAIIAYPMILSIAPLVRMFFLRSGIAPAQLGPQMIYFNILIYASILGLFRGVFSGFFSGIGRTKTVLAASIITLIVNITASYALILGHFGAPSLGIRGAGYATIIGSASGVLILAGSYFFGNKAKEYEIRGSLRYDREILGKLLKFGSPAGAEFALTFSAFGFMIMLFQSQSQIAATASSIAFNWDMAAYVPLIGIEIAVTSLVGRYKGARDVETAHKSAMSGLKTGVYFSALMLVLFAVVPRPLIEIFRPAAGSALFEQAYPLSLFMVHLMSIYVMSDAAIVVYCGALRGAGDTFGTMCISVVMHWLMVGIVFTLLKILKATPEITWIAIIAWIMALSFVFFLRYRSGRWKDIRVIGQSA